MSAPDYYKTLSIPSTATAQQIRDAYKKAALKHHPDRVPSDSPERATRTKKFQQINDAYYTLSDATRRRDYDSARQFQSFASGSGGGGGGGAQTDEGFDADEEIPRPADGGKSSGGGFPWSAFGGMFGGNPNPEAAEEKFSQEQFGSVFEEMMREEGMAEGNEAAPTGKFWGIVGGVSGGAMGFIVANLPGAVAGAVAGNRLGAVRDAKGKSVYNVYMELEQPQRMRLLSELAAKVFAHAVSG
ncbi:DnaJ-domain-containing protein [Aulographum hederae CBS 113979]|uniref:DnaJ-domain-containing protein n=1 Tax=Aulographum hederae CBS 113979 TaxID=1176131 RepID=A0A6G1GNL9_9PEZI|nr:DnaJ-domain-containing protein [Aulographum hederae CBS 113979]